MYLDDIEDLLNIATDGLCGNHKPSYRLFKIAGDFLKATDFYGAINSRNLDTIRFWRRRAALQAEKNVSEDESARILAFIQSSLFMKNIANILKILSLEDEVDQLVRTSDHCYSECRELFEQCETEVSGSSEAKKFVRARLVIFNEQTWCTDVLAQNFLFRCAKTYPNKDDTKVSLTLCNRAGETKPCSPLSRISDESSKNPKNDNEYPFV